MWCVLLKHKETIWLASILIHSLPSITFTNNSCLVLLIFFFHLFKSFIIYLDIGPGPVDCPSIPFVSLYPWQRCGAWSWCPGGLRAGSASDQTHTVGRPGHQCWNADQQWILGNTKDISIMFQQNFVQIFLPYNYILQEYQLSPPHPKEGKLKLMIWDLFKKVKRILF